MKVDRGFNKTRTGTIHVICYVKIIIRQWKWSSDKCKKRKINISRFGFVVSQNRFTRGETYTCYIRNKDGYLLHVRMRTVRNKELR